MSMLCLEAGPGPVVSMPVANVPVAVKQTRDFLRCDAMRFDVTMSDDVCRFVAEAMRCDLDSWPHVDVRRCDSIR